MKVSARNQIGGTIVEVTPGAVTASVKVDIFAIEVERQAIPIGPWRP
jgi:molybdopterin-binding protein